MPQTPDFKVELKLLETEGTTLDSIARTPRIFKPQDLKAACQNTRLVCTPPTAPPWVLAIVEYIAVEFFVLAHRTGLYNRQKTLWSSLAKVSSVSVFQLTEGLFNRRSLPLYDLHFQDYCGRTFILGHFVDPSHPRDGAAIEKLFANFLKRAEKISPLTGLFLCFPEPFPEDLLSKVSQLTDAADPVARYESILPAPIAATLNLLAISIPTDKRIPAGTGTIAASSCKESEQPENQAPACNYLIQGGGEELSTAEYPATADRRKEQADEHCCKVRLVHPNLTTGRRIRAAAGTSLENPHDVKP